MKTQNISITHKSNSYRSVKSLALLLTMVALILTGGWRLSASGSSAQLYNGAGFFGTNDIIELKIEADLSAVFNDQSTNPEYREGILEHEGKTYSLKLKPRGNYRKKTCNMPPLKLNFKKKEVIGTPFDGIDKIKIVTECFASRNKFEDIITQEYLIYRMYNILTPYSFRVRMAKIRYVDTSGEMEPYTSLSFFIEDDDQMAHRLDMEKLDHRNIPQEHTDRQLMTLLAVFNYLIGNTDWSVSNLHNIQLLQKQAHEPPVAVPYDFDWSELVNAPYSISNTKDVKENQEKEYKGHPRSEKELEEVFEIFRENREEIYMLYEECPYLSDKGKRTARRELDDFYHTINSSKLAGNVFNEQGQS